MPERYLKLALAEGFGPSPVPALLDPSAAPDEALHTTRRLPPAVRARLEDAGLGTRARALLEAATRAGLTVLTPVCDGYPARLREVPLRPLVLFARGELDLLRSTRRSCAVVGSRTPTPYGIAAAETFSAALARAGFALWSGLAVGIDAAAHRTALAVGAPTVAVLAGGLDQVYPTEHQRLAEEIVTGGGLLLSELPPGCRAQRGHFPRRNRIMAWAADAVLVVEAGLSSGSMHTARFAADAGVSVFAVPGPYTSRRSQGCHALVADGAQIARDPEDLLRRLGIDTALHPGADGQNLDLDADQTAILTVLEQGPRPSDLIERESGLQSGRYLNALFALTSKQLVRALPGDLLARVKP